MIKNMDIPTQIKHANIKFLSKLVEDLGKKMRKQSNLLSNNLKSLLHMITQKI